MKSEQYVALIVIIIFLGFILFLLMPKKNSKQTTERSARSSSSVSSSSASSRSQTEEKGPPAMQIDASKTYTAVLNTTEGTVKIELNAKATPVTVNNFVALARKGFYNNTIFHRVIKGFMIQGGDPQGNGTGGPGYRFKDEPFEGEYTRGTIAMANAGPNTNGSQFFIMHQDVTQLPKNYVIFGHVTEGMDTVDKIASAPVEDNGMGEESKPVNPVQVKTVEIIEQ